MLRKLALGLVFVGVLAFLSVAGFAVVLAATSAWLHLEVESGGEDTVKVNVPLVLVSTVLPLIDEGRLNNGKIEIDGNEITIEEMREIWATLKSQGDFEMASVQTDDLNLKIVLEGDYLIVHSSEQAKTLVNVELHREVVDALLSGSGNELNLEAAIEALQRTGGKELVSVRNDDTRVQVWID
ncbi:MAG: hypothetical protein ACRD1R_02140 [Acidobacteriota bacterium]